MSLLMNLLSILRQHQTRAARLAAALFAAGWLGFAVAPCQAMAPAPDETPHHGSAPTDDCGHCAPAEKPLDCADAAPADCASSAPPMIESREGAQPKPGAAIPSASFDSSSFALVPRTYRPAGANAAPTPRASLQQRYCSFLK
ncbi:MAG: hypothetical protein ACT4UQ_00445 [Gammaproteobacteria bacterium]